MWRLGNNSSVITQAPFTSYFLFCFLETVFHRPGTGHLAPAIHSLQFPRAEITNAPPHLAFFPVFWGLTSSPNACNTNFNNWPLPQPYGLFVVLNWVLLINIFCNSDYQKDKTFGIEKFITWGVRHAHIHSKYFILFTLYHLNSYIFKFSYLAQSKLGNFTSCLYSPLAFIAVSVNCHHGTE